MVTVKNHKRSFFEKSKTERILYPENHLVLWKIMTNSERGFIISVRGFFEKNKYITVKQKFAVKGIWERYGK